MVNEVGGGGEKRGRETQPLLAGKMKKGIKLIYNAKGTGKPKTADKKKKKSSNRSVV